MHAFMNAMRGAAVAMMAVVFQHCALAAQPTSATAWDAYTRKFIEATFDAQPHFAVWAGRHEFDGRLQDWSAIGIKKEIKRLHELRRRALSFKDSTLSDKQRFERDYIAAAIDGDLFWLETVDWPSRNPDFYSWGL